MEYLIIQSDNYSFIKNTIKSNVRTFLEKNLNSDYVRHLLTYFDEDEPINESLDCMAEEMLDGFVGIFLGDHNNNDRVYINYPDDEFALFAVIESNNKNSFRWNSVPKDEWYWKYVGSSDFFKYRN